ncbi:MAG: phosphatidylserine decarboxylase [Candidatus Viridilinea halotolerans]|uniref:Phosphatidylserine decarboxylase n=1 Tax=Candidatus Viridilinea halotolerans TaxID=2491704 RepID=A0A426TV32_9CHLR|nr:MAG: phosphatidylserine decarboxylase [Candidatus Viridilinea halotolerans]
MPEQTLPKERTPAIPGLDPDGMPLLGLGLGLTGLTLGLRPRFAAVPLALTALAAAFYRDPKRATPQEPGTLFALADGVVLQVEEVYEHRFIHSDCLRLSVHMTPLSVPVCRSPAPGVVRMVEHVAGEFRAASDAEAGERNERIYIGLQTDWGPLLIALIAGPVARRLVCRVNPGDRVEAGARLGAVRFGARADLYVQRDAAHFALGRGARLVAGVTRLGEVAPSP